MKKRLHSQIISGNAVLANMNNLFDFDFSEPVTCSYMLKCNVTSQVEVRVGTIPIKFLEILHVRKSEMKMSKQLDIP